MSTSISAVCEVIRELAPHAESRMPSYTVEDTTLAEAQGSNVVVLYS